MGSLQLVYRILRKISALSIGGFYSEVYVEGVENVETEGPLIIASTHHNEIIDIATLAATIPHRRHISFWAKSSMFSNPISRAVLESSGAIPVKRNPNNDGNASNSSTHAPTQTRLFRESSIALAEGKVLGVFPEGTSYTQPCIMQVMSGAAWASVDYIKWQHENTGVNDSSGTDDDKKVKELTIVPVGIVYTDKSHYQSRVLIRYGSPIAVRAYADDLFTEGVDTEAAARESVKKIMNDVEHQIRAMTINAPDWDTLHAAEMARDILWGDSENIPLKYWVPISQSLVDLFSDDASSSNSTIFITTKIALTQYHALLYYTNISHASLNVLLPARNRVPFGSSALQTFPLRILARILFDLCSLILFIPPMIFYIPAYLTGALSARLFVPKGEMEAEAQFKTIFGGLGLGIGLGIMMGILRSVKGTTWVWDMISFFISVGSDEQSHNDRVKMLTILSVAYGSIHVLVKWHNALVCPNNKRFRILLTLCKLTFGLIPQRPASATELEAFKRHPPPPPNRFIKRNTAKSKQILEEEETYQEIPDISTRKLIRPLLLARKDAEKSLEKYLECLEIEVNDETRYRLLNTTNLKR